MVKYGYSSTPTRLTNEPLPDEVLTDIGRLVRACAGIEDILTLFICRLADIPEGKGALLLGRTNFATRKAIAKSLAITRGEDEVKRCDTFLSDDLETIVVCRNTVAHGIYLGSVTDPRKAYAFQVATIDGLDEGKVGHRVVTYQHEYIKLVVKSAEHADAHAGTHLKVEAYRKSRLRPPLLPNRKGRQQPKRDKAR